MRRRHSRPQDTDIVEALAAMAEHSQWQPSPASIPGATADTLALSPAAAGWRLYPRNIARYLARHPWRSLAFAGLSIACAWVCRYFGATVLAAGLTYAAQHHDANR